MFYNLLSITQWSKVLLSIALALILCISYPLPAQAQAQNQNPLQVALARLQSLFVPRTKLGVPVGSPRGGAGRGRCPEIASLGETEYSLTALVPKISNPLNQLKPSSNISLNDEIVWGTTVAEYPTFWFYLPFHRQEDLEFAKFVLMDENKHLVTERPILVKLPDAAVVGSSPVIAKFTLPSSEKPLEIGPQSKQYKWFFSIVCDARKPSRNPSVSGWIQRITPPFAIAQIQNTPTPRDYLYYAQSGIWYDTVTRLAASRMTSLQPQSGAIPDKAESSPSDNQMISPQPSDESVPAEVKQSPMPPLPSLEPLPLPQRDVEEDWVGLFRFLLQPPELSREAINQLPNQKLGGETVNQEETANQINQIASKMARAPIVELLPILER